MISSCDNVTDAVMALAKIYVVESESICRLLRSGWPSFVAWEDGISPFKDPGVFAHLMGRHLKSPINVYDVHEAAYYHRTRYGGSIKWFDNGILDAKEGISKMLLSIKECLSQDEYQQALTCALENVNDRDQGHGYVGPYAFDILEDAKRARRPGLNYDVPEFLYGRYWDVQLREKIVKTIETKLLPVVVKFKARPTCSDSYITGVWHYLYRETCAQDMEPYAYTKSSGTVGGNDIIGVIEV